MEKVFILFFVTVSLFAQIDPNWTTTQKQFARKGDLGKFNVLWYGIKEGSVSEAQRTINSTNFNALIDIARNNEIYFPKDKRYEFNATLTIDVPLIIDGNNSIIYFTPSSVIKTVFAIASDSVIIRNLSIISDSTETRANNRPRNGSNLIGIYINDTDTLNDITISNYYNEQLEYGIDINKVKNLLIDNFTSRSTMQPIFGVYINNGLFRNLDVHDIGGNTQDHAIYLEGTNRFALDGMKINIASGSSIKLVDEHVPSNSHYDVSIRDINITNITTDFNIDIQNINHGVFENIYIDNTITSTSFLRTKGINKSIYFQNVYLSGKPTTYMYYEYTTDSTKTTDITIKNLIADFNTNPSTNQVYFANGKMVLDGIVYKNTCTTDFSNSYITLAGAYREVIIRNCELIGSGRLFRQHGESDISYINNIFRSSGAVSYTTGSTGVNYYLGNIFYGGSMEAGATNSTNVGL